MVPTANRRKVWRIAVLGASLLVLFVALATLNAFNTQLPRPATTQQIVIFTGLSIVAFLLFVTVLVILVRNVLKLYADQRNRAMGTRLRTRMLWGAVLVSLIPLVFMFLFSYDLMNRSANARAEAQSIVASLPSIDDRDVSAANHRACTPDDESTVAREAAAHILS